MDEWIRLYVNQELTRAGYQEAAPVAQASSGEASIFAFETARNGVQALSAFAFETLESGERLPTGRTILPYPTASTQPAHARPDPWLVFETWSDLDPEYQVIVGRLRDRRATRCSAVSPVSTEQLPVHDGIVLGWVDTSKQIIYRIS